MQGTFEPSHESGDVEDELDEEEKDARGKRLAAMSNVPWGDLGPSVDRKTARLMNDHREREIKYETLTPEQKAFVPRVNPYPEAPDAVFPGNPCYRITIGGNSRYVFVIDRSTSQAYPTGWDGQPRAQSVAWWIVPHFIYRDEDAVTLQKECYKSVYDNRAVGGYPPPNKFDFDSTVLLVGDPHNLGIHQSYYVRGTPNTVPGITIPSIFDPLFCHGFNTTIANPNLNLRITPWPYNQPHSVFPQQPEAPFVRRVVPVGGGGAAGGGAAGAAGAGAAGGGAAGAGRGRGRGRGAAPAGGAAGGPPAAPAARVVYQRVPPHATLLRAMPPIYHGKAGIDWIDVDQNNVEIDRDVLRADCEQAEELDYAFALNMQGLRGTNLSAVWVCTDPEFDVTDRTIVMQQFVKMFMEKFYGQVGADGSTEVSDVVQEALRMHEEFCKGWVTRHHKTLSSEVTAMSEALLGMFYDDLKPCFPPGLVMSRQHLSRYMRRNPTYSGEFAHCLYHYMTSMEQIRGNRNPSYKAMNSEQLVHMNALKSMALMLYNNRRQIAMDLANLNQNSLFFHKYFIDWHYVAGQMPQHHKEFTGYSNSFALYRSKVGGSRTNPFPPWQQMRMVR